MKTQAERIIHKRTRQSYNEFVDDQIAKVMRRLNMATSTTQAADIITAWAQNVAKTLNMQSPTDLPPPTLWQTEQAQKIGLRAILDHLLGVQITPEIAERVNAQISEIADGFEMTLDKTGNPSIQSLKQFDKLNRYIEGLTPSSMVAIMASTVQRSLMLASIKSPIVNIVSNAEMLMTEAFVNRIAGVLTRQSGVGSLVDRKVVRDYLSYAEKAYRAAAVNVSTTRKLDFQKVIKGERIVTTAGSDKFRRAAHLLETGVFKYLMGYPDSISKDLAFVDYVQARATKEAERAKVKDARRAATDIFKDACLLEPRTEIGQKIREEGQIVANKTTFTDNSALAQASVKVRDAFNIATGDWRIGDQIAPFVKTPANVSQVTLEYALGSLWTAFKAKQIISDIRAGELSAVSRRAIEAGVRNGLGVALAMLIASAIDDDDYIPPLFMITDPGTRQQLLDAGSVFNAIRVGDHFVSLDFLGPLGAVLPAVLIAKKQGMISIPKTVGQSVLSSSPVGDMVESISRLGDTQDDLWSMNGVAGAAASYASRWIPAILRDMAKMTDEVDRDTRGDPLAILKSAIPGLRQTLPERQSIIAGGARPAQSPGITLLFGSRVKKDVSSSLGDEIARLNKTGVSIPIRLPSKSSKTVRDLPDSDKRRIDEAFVRLFSTEATAEISSGEYKALSDDEKAAVLKEIRRDVMDEIIERYR